MTIPYRDMLLTQALILAAIFVHQLHASPAHHPKQPVATTPSKETTVYAIDLASYVLPTSGIASTTTFNLGSEFSQGTACGVDALPSGAQLGSSPGTGPGYLYAAFNQLAFGAAYGPGPACGLCYSLTPVSSSGENLTSQSTTFMIIDSCPANDQANKPNCGQCSATAQNDFGKTFHFDIAVDAMGQGQYEKFFQGVTDGSDWNTVGFEQVGCDGGANARPDSLKDWGCVEDCQSKEEPSNVC